MGNPSETGNTELGKPGMGNTFPRIPGKSFLQIIQKYLNVFVIFYNSPYDFNISKFPRTRSCLGVEVNKNKTLIFRSFEIMKLRMIV